MLSLGINSNDSVFDVKKLRYIYYKMESLRSVVKGRNSMKTILIVEDDMAMSRGITLAMQQLSYEISEAPDLKTARHKLSLKPFDLVLLDINLPDGNGLEFCREVREKFGSAVIFITANDLEVDEVIGLEVGADDYITKPFSLAVLRARVQAVLRRNEEVSNKTFYLGSFSFNFDNMTFFKGNVAFDLSKTEQRLLKVLIVNRGQVLSRQKLLERIWDGGEFVDENALSVAVRRLREKIEDDPKKPQYIKTIYGIGYTWVMGSEVE